MASRTWKTWTSSSHLRMEIPTRWTCCRTTLSSMTGRTAPPLREPQPRAEHRSPWRRFRLLWMAGLCAATVIAAAQTPPPPPATPPSPPPSQTVPPQTPPSSSTPRAGDPPDDDLIEFLGGDDVGD